MESTGCEGCFNISVENIYIYLHVYINIIIYLKYKHNIFFLNIYIHACMCIYIYIINIHCIHTLCKEKLLFWMRLIIISRLTELVLMHLTIKYD